MCAPGSRNAGAAQKRFAPKEDRGVSAELVAAMDDGEVWDEAVARARLAVAQILRAAALHRAVDELRAMFAARRRQQAGSRLKQQSQLLP